MIVWIVKGTKAGQFTNMPDDDAENAIKGGWVESPRRVRSLSRPDKSPHRDSDGYFTEEIKDQSRARSDYATREMRDPSRGQPKPQERSKPASESQSESETQSETQSESQPESESESEQRQSKNGHTRQTRQKRT